MLQVQYFKDIVVKNGHNYDFARAEWIKFDNAIVCRRLPAVSDY